MEELFDNIFVLVPVALIIFLRVFAEGVRKRMEKAKKPATKAAAPEVPANQARSKPQGSSREARPRMGSSKKAKVSDSKPGSARIDLLSRLKDYLSGTLDQQAERLEPLHFEEETTRRLGQFRTQAIVPPDTKPVVTTGYKEGLPGAMEESAAITREPVARYAFPERLTRLPPLKRAIVLSEVLGKPKSMQ